MLEQLSQLTLTIENFPEKLIGTAVILVLAVVARIFTFFALKAIIDRFDDNDPETDTALEIRAHTLGNVVKGALNVIIYGIAFITVLSEWGINVAPILTGAGIMGLAVGFGAQTLVKDAINGFFILLENEFNVGDHVKVAGLKGRVINMSLRSTVLKTESKELHSIPNSQIDIVTKYPK